VEDLEGGGGGIALWYFVFEIFRFVLLIVNVMFDSRAVCGWIDVGNEGWIGWSLELEDWGY